jgi:hypothetical protein
MLSSLQRATDDYYPGMFIPSTLIIIMNEIKRGHYSVKYAQRKARFYRSLHIGYNKIRPKELVARQLRHTRGRIWQKIWDKQFYSICMCLFAKHTTIQG